MEQAFVAGDLKKKIAATCDWASAAANVPDALSAECVLLLNEASAQIENVNMYNIYGDCVSTDGCKNGDGDANVRGKVPARETYEIAAEGTRQLGRVTPHGPTVRKRKLDVSMRCVCHVIYSHGAMCVSVCTMSNVFHGGCMCVCNYTIGQSDCSLHMMLSIISLYGEHYYTYKSSSHLTLPVSVYGGCYGVY